MKVNYSFGYVLITFLVFNIFNTSAQNIRGGLLLGINADQVDGDNLGGYNKPELNAGLTAQMSLSDAYHLMLRMDLLFSQAGAEASFLSSQNPLGFTYSLTLNYIQVPIVLDYVYQKKYGVGFGFALGRLVGGSYNYNGYVFPVQIGAPYPGATLDDYYQPWDINVVLDGLYLVNGNHWMINVRWMYSMRFISKNYGGQAPGQPPVGPSHFYNNGEFNNILALRVVYVLGQPAQH